MRITNLEDEVFYGFANKKINFNPDIHEHEFIKGTDRVCLKIYLGGEIEDIRTFNFKDYECGYLDGRLHKSVRIDADWVKYLVKNTELGEDKKYIDGWNLKVQEKIDRATQELNSDFIL